MPEFQDVAFSVNRTVAELVIDRPQRRNAISAQVLRDILHALDRCSNDGQRLLIIRGSGEFFSSGADLNEMTGLAVDGDWFDLINQVSSRLASCNVVSIAAIEGGCLGSGLDLAIACDIRVSTPGAYFGLPALEMGLVYRPETFRRLVGLAGASTAMRLSLLGDRISAEDAFRMGLLSQLTSDPVVGAQELAERLAALPATAMLETVRMINGLVDATPISDAWAQHHRDSLASDDRLAAVSAKRVSLGLETT